MSTTSLFFSGSNFMKQSAFPVPAAPHHVGIIMDGNGRWATRRGRPRIAGHLAGADAVRRVVEAAPGLGIRILTLYAFSADNWQRPPREVAALMGLFRKYLSAETARLVAERRTAHRHRPARSSRGSRSGGRSRRPRKRPRAGRSSTSAWRSTTPPARRSFAPPPACATGTALAATGSPSSSASAAVTGGRRRRRRSRHPHRRRAAVERLSSLGVRVRRAPLHAADVARLRRGRPGPRGAGLSGARPSLRSRQGGGSRMSDATMSVLNRAEPATVSPESGRFSAGGRPPR